MVLSKRERYIGIATGAVLGLVVLCKVAIFPLQDERIRLSGQIEIAQNDLNKANDLIKLSERAKQNWSTISGGHLRKDESEAESQIYNSVRDWASEAGLNLASVKPERAPEKEKDFFKLTFRATGTGSMGQIGRFLYRLQTATMPVRVTDISLSSRKEGVDDLTLSVAIATIYLAPETKQNGATASAGWEVQR